MTEMSYRTFSSCLQTLTGAATETMTMQLNLVPLSLIEGGKSRWKWKIGMTLAEIFSRSVRTRQTIKVTDPTPCPTTRHAWWSLFTTLESILEQVYELSEKVDSVLNYSWVMWRRQVHFQHQTSELNRTQVKSAEPFTILGQFIRAKFVCARSWSQHGNWEQNEELGLNDWR